MADLEKLEGALQNAHRAGDTRAAKHLANEIKAVRAGTMKHESPESDIMKTFRGYSDAASTYLSNIGGSIAGSTYGFGKGIYNAVQDGTYGTQEGVGRIRETMDEVKDQFSKGEAYTPEGQQVMDDISEAVQPVAEAIMDWDRDARVLEPIAMMPGSPLGPAYRSMAISAGAPHVARETLRRTGEVATAPVRGVREAGRRLTDPPANNRSMGAAETDKARERITTSQGTPIPFEGDSGLTRGQATRDAKQLKEEYELANDNNPEMQERRRNQQIVANQNFDAMEQDIGAAGVADNVEAGAQVRGSVEAYRAQRKAEKDQAYKEAREAGETEQLIPEITGLNNLMQEAWRYRHGTEQNEKMFKIAMEMNIIDKDGNLKPLTIGQAEDFRKQVNNTYDASVPNQARWRGMFIDTIDETLDAVPAGEKYRRARGIARDFYNEFDQSPLASGLSSNRARTNVERIPDEKVAQKVAQSSVQEVNQLKATMNATPEGAQSWKQVQAAFLNDIRKSAFGTQTSDVTGTPVLTASTFKKKVRDLDESGKLETILGREQAQSLRDLVEVADSIASLPPGSVNTSRTAAEIFRRIRGLAPAGTSAVVEATTFGGLPLMTIGGFLGKGAVDKVKLAKSLDGQSLLEGL